MFVDIFSDEEDKKEEAGGEDDGGGRKGEGDDGLRPPLRAAGPYKYISST